jgi:hypothetical protein
MSRSANPALILDVAGAGAVADRAFDGSRKSGRQSRKARSFMLENTGPRRASCGIRIAVSQVID